MRYFTVLFRPFDCPGERACLTAALLIFGMIAAQVLAALHAGRLG